MTEEQVSWEVSYSQLGQHVLARAILLEGLFCTQRFSWIVHEQQV